MRVVLGLVLGISIGLCGSALAGGSRDARVGPPCFAWTQNGYVCDLPDPPSVRTTYEIRIRSLDLDCTVNSASAAVGTSETFGCDRNSRLSGNCTDGYFGSLAVYMSSIGFEVAKPSRCVTNSSPAGFKITSFGRSYTFNRVP